MCPSTGSEFVQLLADSKSREQAGPTIADNSRLHLPCLRPLTLRYLSLQPIVCALDHQFVCSSPHIVPDAPAAIGPYSQAIKVGNLLFCSGCIPLDPVSAQIVAGGVEEQTEQALKNLKAVVEAGGSELNKVVKTTVGIDKKADIIILILSCAGVLEIDGRFCKGQYRLRQFFW